MRNLKWNSLRWILAPAAIGVAGMLLLLSSCAERRSWTPYSQPEGKSIWGQTVRSLAEHRDDEAIARDNASCMGCHSGVHDPHGEDTAMPISCVECHGGNGRIFDKDEAHPKPDHPEWWPEGGANPKQSYTHLLKENIDWVRFINPGDLRVANMTCGGCHPKEVLNVKKSIMTTATHFFGVAAYANGIVSTKRSIFSESYSAEGVPQIVNSLIKDKDTGKWRWPTDEEVETHSYAKFGVPIPNWEVTQTANIFRTFEQGSRLGGAALGFNGLPVPVIGLPDKLEDAGKPNNRNSDRGLGTLNRVDLPVLNLHKTRLNDPHLSFLGTNEQPGDYRSSGCTACHMVYANDRDPVHSGPYAKYGNMGEGNVAGGLFGDKDEYQHSVDPTMIERESGHPLMHKFTKAIPSSQCMTCHMHQPNSFVNPFFGYHMWTYETDGEQLWPEEQKYPVTHREWYEGIMANPEGAAVLGNWGDLDFLKDVSSINPSLKHTQFSDYHGHGWVFRAVFKTDRKGNLLDSDGNIVDYDDPKKFEGVIPELGMEMDLSKANTPGEEAKHWNEVLSAFAPKPGKPVHLKDIHAELGMHCVDCHFEQDVHGNGMVYAEYQAAVEIKCQDCHGTAERYASLKTSGPGSKGFSNSPTTVARDESGSLDLLKHGTTPWGTKRFERKDNKIVQRSMLYKGLEWEVSQVKDTVTQGHDEYNERAFKAKMLKSQSREGCLAHSEDSVECYSCHTSWITACFGCHLPQKANWKTPVNHFEGKTLRNYASYNPQVARDDAFLLGIAPNVKGNRISTVRSSSAVLISSEDAQRRILYPQIPTIAGNGMSSPCFNTHFVHPVRKTETRGCTDCHVSSEDDNNAWLSQVFLLGANYVNFMGYHAYVGRENGFQAIRVTEWEEPQALIGSNLQRLAFPDHFKAHMDRDRELAVKQTNLGSGVRSLQLRGEYLFAALGKGGFRAFDVANVANKDFSEKMVTQPFSPLGHQTHVATEFATAISLPTNNHINMGREFRPENKETPYYYKGKAQNMHELYRYVYVSDKFEGLIVIDIDTLSNWEPRDNFLSRAATFNPDGILNGAVNLTVAGSTVYVCCDRGIVAVDIDDPLEPKVIAEIGSPSVTNPTSIKVMFRYAFVTDEAGMVVLDVTWPEKMRAIAGSRVSLAEANDVYIAREYAYVAGGSEGLVILDVQNPENPSIVTKFTAEGKIGDLRQVKVAMTYDSLYAYLADGVNGFHVVQLVTAGDGPRSPYGFSPEPKPKLISSMKSSSPLIAISKGLDRDRAVDESGNQMAVFGRIGGRPMNKDERERFYVLDGDVYKVNKDGDVFLYRGGKLEPVSKSLLYGDGNDAGNGGTPRMGPHADEAGDDD